MGTKKSDRGFLGRWAAASSQDKYVRTAMCIVENLQIPAAHEAVLLLNGGFGQFGEETTLEGLRAFLVRRPGGRQPAGPETDAR